MVRSRCVSVGTPLCLFHWGYTLHVPVLTCVSILALSVRVCGVPLAESEGTLILPQVESFHRPHDDDATTVTSDDSFFSAAEVSSQITGIHCNRHLFVLIYLYLYLYTLHILFISCPAVWRHVSGRRVPAPEACSSLWRSLVSGAGGQSALQVPEVTVEFNNCS